MEMLPVSRRSPHSEVRQRRPARGGSPDGGGSSSRQPCLIRGALGCKRLVTRRLCSTSVPVNKNTAVCPVGKVPRYDWPRVPPNGINWLSVPPPDRMASSSKPGASRGAAASRKMRHSSEERPNSVTERPKIELTGGGVHSGNSKGGIPSKWLATRRFMVSRRQAKPSVSPDALGWVRLWILMLSFLINIPLPGWDPR